MRQRSIAAVLLLSSACATPSSEWGWAPQEILVAPSQSDYHEKPAVYLLKDVSITLVSRWRDDSYTRWHRHNVIAILNEKGFKYADVRIPYPEKGRFARFEARTINADGSITAVAPERIYDDQLTKKEEEEEGNNAKARVFSFPEVKVGSILEYQYILEVPLFYASISEYLNDELPVKRYRLSIVGTSDIAYKIKAYNTAAPFQTDKSGEHWTITWSLDDVPASNEEEFRLGRSFLDPWVSFVVTRRSKFSRSFEYYTDWDHGLEKKGDELYYKADEYYASFEPKVDFTGCSDKVCRIQRAIDHLEQSYPFRGWGSYPGRTAKEATDAKRASGFEKNRLLWKILAQEGIDAKFAFVHRYLSGYLDRDLASWHAGNHLILRVEKQEGVPEPIWVDAACEYCSVGEVPVWLKDAEAMVVHASKPPPSLKTVTKAELVKVTGKPNHDEGYLREYRMKVDPSGHTEVDTLLSERGRTCMDQRNQNLDTTADVWKKRAEDLVKDRYGGASLVSFEPMREEAGICKRTVRFSAPGYANLDEGRLLVPLTLFRSTWDRSLRNDAKRELQIAFADANNTTETAVIDPPDGFEPIRLPKKQVATAKGVTVSVSAEREGDSVRVTRSIQIHPGLYQQTNYPEIVAALDTFSSIRQDVIELGPKPSGEVSGSRSGEALPPASAR